MIELAINLETIYPGIDFCDKIRGVIRPDSTPSSFGAGRIRT